MWDYGRGGAMDVREAQGGGAPKPLRFGLHAALFCDEGNFLFYKNTQNNFNLHILSRIDSGIHKHMKNSPSISSSTFVSDFSNTSSTSIDRSAALFCCRWKREEKKNILILRKIFLIDFFFFQTDWQNGKVWPHNGDRNAVLFIATVSFFSLLHFFFQPSWNIF